MKTDAQFVNTLEDNIHEHGAITKLISDQVQVEISICIKNSLCTLVITSWRSEPHQQHQNLAELTKKTCCPMQSFSMSNLVLTMLIHQVID